MWKQLLVPYKQLIHDLQMKPTDLNKNRWIEIKEQLLTNHCNFHVLTTNHITTALTQMVTQEKQIQYTQYFIFYKMYKL